MELTPQEVARLESIIEHPGLGVSVLIKNYQSADHPSLLLLKRMVDKGLLHDFDLQLHESGDAETSWLRATELGYMQYELHKSTS